MIKFKQTKCKVDLKEIKKRMPYIMPNIYDGYSVKINFVDVALKEKTWLKSHPKQPADGNTFRGYCQTLYHTKPMSAEIFIFIEPFYTTDVILWLIMHELTHFQIRTCPVIAMAFQNKRSKYAKDVEKKTKHKWSNELYLKDKIHDAVPEEMFCDDVATSIIGKYYGRRWWRKELAK